MARYRKSDIQFPSRTRITRAVMRILRQQQQLPIDAATAWAFFSNPRNLEVITPPWLNFRIVYLDQDQIYAGQFITYRIRLAPMVWVRWVTEIEEVEEPVRFRDVQRIGPYAVWRHTHVFEPNADGVLMTDEVEYATGWGPFGWVAEQVYVHRSVNRIFAYRRQVLEERFKA